MILRLSQWSTKIVLVVFAITALYQTSLATACPFCSAVSQTLRQEMETMDAVVIATALQSDATRDKDTGEVLMKVERVLKGDDLVSAGAEVRAIYYGEVEVGRHFMLSGVDPPQLQWSCLPVTDRAEAYIVNITQLSDDQLERLRFYQSYLQDDESMLARDAYDEFAIAPYDIVKQLGPEMNQEQLIAWISDPEMPTDRKRLYLTMLGACGSEEQLPMLESMLRSTQKSTRGGLDALIACYLTLAQEQGLPLINELFMANKQAPYADTYAAIMAIRFHGTEGNVIARSALLESLHPILDRKDLADLVIPDLARWNDWSQIDRLVQLFKEADKDNNWIRVPVINYLRACPKPEAKEAIEELNQIDPAAVKRANTFFSIPVPTRDTSSDGSAVDRESDVKYAGLGLAVAKPGERTALNAAIPAPVALATGTATGASNSWRLAYVLGMALATVMIIQFLILTGGSRVASR